MQYMYSVLQYSAQPFLDKTELKISAQNLHNGGTLCNVEWK